MTPLSPKLASELAYLPYQFISNKKGKVFVVDSFVTKEFSLSKQQQTFKVPIWWDFWYWKEDGGVCVSWYRKR